jgi:flagellar biosynthesis protein FlhA
MPRKIDTPKPDKPETKEETQELKFMKFKGEKAEFMPWKPGESGTQCYYKIKKAKETAFLYAGESFFKEAEIQKPLMRFLNSGWEIEGKLTVNFEGDIEEDHLEKLMPMELLCLEVGSALLPLLDQSQGAPLLGKINQLRQDLAETLGVILPGIKVKDNLKLPPNAYMLILRGTPLAGGELYLGKLMAVGTLEALSNIKGWSAIEPSFHLNAKWIDPEAQALAEKSQCMVVAPFNVLLTHVRSILFYHAKEFLGLQELAFMLQKLGTTHPVLVEDFLNDGLKLRKARRILLNLLNEKVSIKDLVTIFEVLGEHLDELDRIDLVTEEVRMALRRQICWQLLDPEGKIRALVLSTRMEQKIQNALRESHSGLYLELDNEEVELILKQVKQALDESPVTVVFTEPTNRLYFRNLVERAFPQLNVLSTMEIAAGIKVEIAKEIDLPE